MRLLQHVHRQQFRAPIWTDEERNEEEEKKKRKKMKKEHRCIPLKINDGLVPLNVKKGHQGTVRIYDRPVKFQKKNGIF